MFLNNGWYWDDWCLSSKEGINTISKGVGIPIMIPVNSALFSLTEHPALVYHIITIIIEITGIWLFYRSLLLLDINRSNGFIITLFFALIPFNQAKMAMACFMYTIGFLFFIIAVFLFLNFVRKNSLILRILALFFFLCSFVFLPSTLVLSLALFLFLAVYLDYHNIEFNIKYLKKIALKMFTWADFVLLPFIFWLFRTFFLRPTGNYASEGYREFSVSSLVLLPVNLTVAIVQNLFGIGKAAEALNQSKIFAVLFIVVLIIVYILLIKVRLENRSADKSVLYVGLFFFLAGAFAYVMVGLYPVFDSFDSRHQILLKFGTAILLFFFICLFNSKRAQIIILSLIVSLFIVSNVSYQLQFIKSWFKQIALEKEFQKERLLTEGTNFIIIDNTLNYNEFNTHYPFYCYSGILRKSFGTETRFAIDSKEMANVFARYNSDALINNPFYHLRDCKNLTSFDYYVVISEGSLKLNTGNNLKLFFQYYFSKVDFNKSVTEIISLKVLSYNTLNLPESVIH